MLSASRVVACLAGYFPLDYSAPTRKEIAIADAFGRVLQDAAYADVDFEEEEDLQVGLNEVEDVEWTPEDDVDGGDFVDPHQKTVTCDGHPITASVLTEALTHRVVVGVTNIYASAVSSFSLILVSGVVFVFLPFLLFIVCCYSC